MKKPFTIFLPIGFILSSGIMLLDRFVVQIPNWLSIICSMLAIVSFVIHIVLMRKRKE